MTHFQAVILGVIQGLTEFFPISSSGHLVLMQQFFGIHDNVLVFDIAVHFGTLLAVVFVFRKVIRTLFAGCIDSLRSLVSGGSSIREVYNHSHEVRTVTGIVIGTIPAVIVGFTLKDFIENLFHSAFLVFIALFITGCVLLVTFFIKPNSRRIGISNGFIIGLSQALAITPGISRSGMTISTALFLGIDREEAGEFSFLLSVPAVFGATILAVKDLFEVGISGFSWQTMLVGAVCAFLSGWISLVVLMRVVKRGKMGYFGFYCLAAAILGFILYGSGSGHSTTNNLSSMDYALGQNTITITSSYDDAEQKMNYFQADGEECPLVVALHTWSSDYTQDVFDEYTALCEKRGWHCIFPDFRGANTKPEACGSEAALNDILDAVEWALETFDVDHRRIFLVGESGGGHMALLISGRYPSKWTAVSAWASISDITRWHAETTKRGLKYAAEMEAICGGAPGASPAVDAEYSKRSPISTVWRANIIPMDINAGIHDGHSGNSVPVGQSIRAFNELAKAAENTEAIVGEDAIEFIEQEGQVPDWCDPGDTFDTSYSRTIYLRRISSLSRLTIFEGGHEILYDSAFQWFDSFCG